MKLKFGAIQIFVSDLEKAKEWYKEKLGFGIIEEFPEYKCALMEFDGIEFDGIEFDIGEPNPSWGEDWEEYKKEIGRYIGVIFETDDIESLVKELEERGIKFVKLPEEKPWGEIRATFVDLDGNSFDILQVKK